MEMGMPALQRQLENKWLTDRQLGRYFATNSPGDLLMELRRLRRKGVFQFEVMLSQGYYDREKSRRDVILRTDVFKPVDVLGRVFERDTYGISVESDTPLSENEIIKLFMYLPPDLAERYLRFKLTNINQNLFEQIIARHKTRGGDDDFYDRIEYRSLVADGSMISYNDEPIAMGFQHRQVVRILIEKQGKLCTKDEFTESPDVFTGENYPDIDITLRKLVADVHRKLRSVVGKNCIKNVPSEGWLLELDP